MAKFIIKNVKKKLEIAQPKKLQVEIKKATSPKFEIKGIGGIKGEKGDTGNGISTITQNANSSITIAMTDGSSFTSMQLKGANGADGQDGADGADGQDGRSATVAIGTTTTGAAGTQAVVTNTGTPTDAVFNFTIPKGDRGERGLQGIQGEQGIQGTPGTPGTPGTAATITVGSTTTGDPGTQATVTNVGTSSAAILNFTIPRGADGQGGGGGGTWGSITGTLSNQTDLQNALDAKANSADLATVATSGSYNDLSNRPTIPAEQVNSDWNATSGKAQILNKPTIPTATSQLTNDSNFINTTDTAYRTAGIPYGVVDSTSTATNFTATVDGITELHDGVCVWLKNGVVTSASGFKININNLGAKPVYNNMAATTAETTLFNINYTMLFVYDSTRVSGGCWVLYRGYNSDTNTIGYQLRTNSVSLPAAQAFVRYRLLFTSPDGTKFVPANTSTSTSSTSSKTPNTAKIDPFGRIVYYSATSTIAANARAGAGYLWEQYAITLGYSFTNSTALALTAWSPVYLKCAPQDDGSAIIDATTPIVQALPTEEDGKIYIMLGIAYSSANIELLINKPVYYYKSGAIRPWVNQIAGGGGGDATWGSITGTLSNQTDLNTALGAKANSSDLATVATSGSYNDLSNTPTIPTVPTNISAFTNDSGYLTSVGTSNIQDSAITPIKIDQGAYSAATGKPSTNQTIAGSAGVTNLTLVLGSSTVFGSYMTIESGAIKCRKAGYIQISGAVAYSGAGAGNNVQARIYNATTNTMISSFLDRPANTSAHSLCIPDVIAHVAANDLLKIALCNWSSSSVTMDSTNTYLTARYFALDAE